MKKLTPLLRLAVLMALAFSFSSCCSMFSRKTQVAGTYTETTQVRTCGYDTVTEQVRVGDGKSGMIETVTKKVPRYKTVTKKVKVKCPDCTRFYCPKADCCGTTSEATIKMATAQGPVGSPHIGLIMTMKPLAP